MNRDNDFADCLPEPIIQHHPVDDEVVQWYEAAPYIGKPHGFYFYTFDEKWCYGPYITFEQAESGFNRWVAGGLP